jgi:hypothetical protein
MRRALLVAVALVASATTGCASGDPKATDAGAGRAGGGVAAGGTKGTTPAPGGVGGSEGGASGPSGATPPSTTARRPAAAPTTTAAGPVVNPGTVASPPSTTRDEGDGDDGSSGPPGAFARTLLRPRPATSIVVERFAQDGASLGPGAIAHATRVLGDVTGKAVDAKPVAAVPSTSRAWTADDVRGTADALGTTAQGGGRAVLRLLLLRGEFEGRDDVLGVAVRGDVLAVFTDSIAGAATPLVSRATIEDAVLAHELGHVLGLVDLARDTHRADPEHPGHSSNPKSVMYWAVESSLVGQVLSGPPPRDFDDADLADLQALRNGA